MEYCINKHFLFLFMQKCVPLTYLIHCYNIKDVILLPQAYVTIENFVYPFGVFFFYSQRFKNYLAFKYFGFERT